MNKAKLSLLLLAGLAFTLTGCDAAVGVFEAGYWGGMVLVVLIVLLKFTWFAAEEKDEKACRTINTALFSFQYNLFLFEEFFA